jgi:hypothetical protein
MFFHDLNLLDLDESGSPVTSLKSPLKRQSSPRSAKGQAKRMKKKNWGNPSGTDTDEDAEGSGYERPPSSQPRRLVEVTVPQNAIDKSKYVTVVSDVSQMKMIRNHLKASQILLRPARLKPFTAPSLRSLECSGQSLR